jgi:hypothetical protein
MIGMRVGVLGGFALVLGAALVFGGVVMAQDPAKDRTAGVVRLVEHVGLLRGPKDYAARRMRASGMKEDAIAAALASPRWSKVTEWFATDLAARMEPAALDAAVSLFDAFSPEQRAAYRAGRVALTPVREQLLWFRQRADCFESSWESFPNSVRRRDELRSAIDYALEGTPAAQSAR